MAHISKRRTMLDTINTLLSCRYVYGMYVRESGNVRFMLHRPYDTHALNCVAIPGKNGTVAVNIIHPYVSIYVNHRESQSDVTNVVTLHNYVNYVD